MLTRPPRLIFAEMKSAKGRVSEAQRDWLDDLDACPGVESYTWRPSDWFDIELILARDPVFFDVCPCSVSGLRLLNPVDRTVGFL